MDDEPEVAVDGLVEDRVDDGALVDATLGMAANGSSSARWCRHASGMIQNPNRARTEREREKIEVCSKCRPRCSRRPWRTIASLPSAQIGRASCRERV